MKIAKKIKFYMEVNFALESLVNALYSLLIKKEFDAGDYERITIKSDMDIRLLTMHLFCNGFKSQNCKVDTYSHG